MTSLYVTCCDHELTLIGGTLIDILVSKRPSLVRALSNVSGSLVAAITITPLLFSKPGKSFNWYLKICQQLSALYKTKKKFQLLVGVNLTVHARQHLIESAPI